MYVGTIFAYGQTGTGKTYTMEGERDEPEKRGIVPNSFAHIFGHIAKCGGEVQYVSYITYINCIKRFVMHGHISMCKIISHVYTWNKFQFSDECMDFQSPYCVASINV